MTELISSLLLVCIKLPSAFSWLVCALGMTPVLSPVWEVSSSDWGGSVSWVKAWDISIILVPVCLLTEWIWVSPCVTDSPALSLLKPTKEKGQEQESGVRVEGRDGRQSAFFFLFCLWQGTEIEHFSHGCLVLPQIDTFAFCYHPWK